MNIRKLIFFGKKNYKTINLRNIFGLKKYYSKKKLRCPIAQPNSRCRKFSRENLRKRRRWRQLSDGTDRSSTCPRRRFTSAITFSLSSSSTERLLFRYRISLDSLVCYFLSFLFLFYIFKIRILFSQSINCQKAER